MLKLDWLKKLLSYYYPLSILFSFLFLFLFLFFYYSYSYSYFFILDFIGLTDLPLSPALKLVNSLNFLKNSNDENNFPFSLLYYSLFLLATSFIIFSIPFLKEYKGPLIASNISKSVLNTFYPGTPPNYSSTSSIFSKSDFDLKSFYT